MNNGFIGYNREVVPELIRKIQENYDNLYRDLTSGIQNDYISTMKTAWICPDAVSFFETEFTNAMNELVSDINVIFASVSEAVNSSCQAYSQAGGDVWTRRDIQTRGFQNYTIRGVIEDYNANLGQGGNLDQYNLANDQLNKIKINCANYTANITAAASNSGFVGANQQEALRAALQTIDNKISDGFSAIINKTNTRVRAAVEQFGQIGASTSTAYTAN